MRRFGEPLPAGRTCVARPGAYAVIGEGGDVLITREAADADEFQLPGGGIEPGEGPLQALRRECLEETGWKIAVLRRLGAFQRFVALPGGRRWARKVCHVYLARPTLRVGPPSEAGHEAIWMPIETAIARVGGDGDRAFLAVVAGRAGRVRAAG
jgi:8-oxo-dGTP diphosphatase